METRINDISASHVPWHIWVVGLLTLLWNAVGAASFTAAVMGKLTYFGMSDAQIAWFDAIPGWVNMFWGLGTWGAFLGSVLILVRSRWAVPVMVAALIGLVGVTIYQLFVVYVPQDIRSPALDLMIWIVTLFMLAYAVRMRAGGVLR